MGAKRSGGRQAATGSIPKGTSPAGAGSYRTGRGPARSLVGAPNGREAQRRPPGRYRVEPQGHVARWGRLLQDIRMREAMCSAPQERTL